MARSEDPKIFGGVRFDVEVVSADLDGLWIGWIGLIDMPLSLGLDVALLPVSVVWEIIRGGPPPANPPPNAEH